MKLCFEITVARRGRQLLPETEVRYLSKVSCVRSCSEYLCGRLMHSVSIIYFFRSQQIIIGGSLIEVLASKKSSIQLLRSEARKEPAPRKTNLMSKKRRDGSRNGGFRGSSLCCRLTQVS